MSRITGYMTFREVYRKGHRHYLYERESYWDPKLRKVRKRTLRYLGPCDARGRITAPPAVRVNSFHSSFPVGSLATLYAAARDLHVVDRIEEVLEVERREASLLLALGLNQAVHRLPLSRVPPWISRSPLPRWEAFDPGGVDRAALDTVLGRLSRLLPTREWDQRGFELQRVLTRSWRNGSREPATCYYDITKQAYYGSECPWAEVGHDPAIGAIGSVVGFGMVVSRDHHHPVLCRPLPGSLSDSVSMATTLEMLRGFGLGQITLVVDRGIVSKENVTRVVESGHHLLGMVRGWTDETRRYATRWTEEGLERPEYVVARSHGNAAYARGFTAPLFGQPKVRVVVVSDARRRVEERQSRDLLVQELGGHPPKGRLGEIRHELGRVVVPSVGRRGFRVDPVVSERERKLDGRFLLFHTDPSVSASEVFRTYFQKDAIEKVFRTAKGPLSLGPLRYRRRDRIEAYATVVYLAYLLWSWSERKLRPKYPGMTLEEAFHTLGEVAWIRFGAGKSVRDWTTRPTEDQAGLLDALGATAYLPVP